MYQIQDREAGNIIEDNLTLEEAKKILKDFEKEDKKDNTYSEDFYEIMKTKTMKTLKTVKGKGIKTDVRTIQLTHEEIETIKIALQYVYDRKLDVVKQNRRTLGEEITQKIIETANKYFDVQDVFDGDRDI